MSKMSKMSKKADLSSQLREAIHASGRSLNQLGQETDVDAGRLSRFLRGERDLTLEAVGRLCNALGLRLSTLWIVVSVAGREAQVQLMPTTDGEWKIAQYNCPSPSSARGTPGKTTQRLFPTLPTVEKAAEHVAGLIRKGVIMPGEGRHDGKINVKRFVFAE